MKIYTDVYDFYDLNTLDMTTQAEENLQIIEDNDKINEFIDYLENYYGDEMSETELSDLLHGDWEEIFEELGIEEENEN